MDKQDAGPYWGNSGGNTDYKKLYEDICESLHCANEHTQKWETIAAQQKAEIGRLTKEYDEEVTSHDIEEKDLKQKIERLEGELRAAKQEVLHEILAKEHLLLELQASTAQVEYWHEVAITLGPQFHMLREALIAARDAIKDSIACGLSMNNTKYDAVGQQVLKALSETSPKEGDYGNRAAF